jgi:copper chaperone CopZ
MKKIVLNVKGMQCHGCENRIINSLKNSNLASNVLANFENGIVEIEVEDKLDEKLIKEKIIDLGFDII